MRPKPLISRVLPSGSGGPIRSLRLVWSSSNDKGQRKSPTNPRVTMALPFASKLKESLLADQETLLPGDNHATCLGVATSQSRTPSLQLAASQRPSGLKATLATDSVLSFGLYNWRYTPLRAIRQN